MELGFYNEITDLFYDTDYSQRISSAETYENCKKVVFSLYIWQKYPIYLYHRDFILYIYTFQVLRTLHEVLQVAWSFVNSRLYIRKFDLLMRCSFFGSEQFQEPKPYIVEQVFNTKSTF